MRFRFRLGVGIALVLAAACIGVSPAAAVQSRPSLETTPVISVLSNRADLVSGGEALVAVTLPRGTRTRDVRTALNGRDITSAFAVRPNGNYEGLVTGLVNGKNQLKVVVGRSGAQMTIVNHASSGPIIAGPQVQPWICSIQLGAPTNAQCDTPTHYSYVYKSTTTDKFETYDPRNPPADVATTTTDEDKAVPYIVRIETGAADREYYQIAVLFDPTKPWAPWSPQAGWNGKLVVPFGGDCNPWHAEGTPSNTLVNGNTSSSSPNDSPLAQGFAVANSAANVLGTNCNSVVSAEALMMLKEHLVETYGPIEYTIGEGCSGGSMQQHWDVSNYPGLLDGIIPQCSFPDIWGTLQEAQDCHLLDSYYDNNAAQPWATAEQDAVDGYVTQSVCRRWEHYAQTWLDPSNSAGCSNTTLPPPGVFDPATNPKGIRCTLPDYQVAIWGQDKKGYANRPYDNVGVQYGLKALLAGKISAAQFVDLNTKIGGIDENWKPQPQRTAANRETLSIAYRTGQVLTPAAAADVPIIDLRAYLNADIHSDYHSEMMRARLDQTTGGHGNQIIWTFENGVLGIDPKAAALPMMDKWLSAIHADQRNVPERVKVVQDKPQGAVDACWIDGAQVTDAATCKATYPNYADPRITAGAPLADNYVKCQLTLLDRRDYPAGTFTHDQWAALQRAFPTGVCDWKRPPVGFEPSIPWLTYEKGPGGAPLPPAPTSQPLRLPH